MKLFLIVAKGTKQGMPIEIPVDLFLIGSDQMCQLRKDSLGSKHCAVMTRDNKVFIRDMDSGQSTLVNGSVMASGEEWPLHAGDRIAVGPLEFMVQFREHALSGKDLEEWGMRCLDGQNDREVDEEEYSTKYNTAASAAQSIIDKLNIMKGLVKGRLRIGTERGITTIRFNDAVLVEDAEIALIKKELCDHLNQPNMRVLLDMKTVRRLSSGAVMMLFDTHRWLAQWGSKMAFCRIRPELISAMSMFEVQKIPIYHDRKTALREKW